MAKSDTKMNDTKKIRGTKKVRREIYEHLSMVEIIAKLTTLWYA